MGTFYSKKVNTDLITTNDLKRYKNILEMTNAHLEGYEPGASILTSRGPKFRNIITKLFPQVKLHVVKTALLQQWTSY